MKQEENNSNENEGTELEQHNWRQRDNLVDCQMHGYYNAAIAFGGLFGARFLLGHFSKETRGKLFVNSFVFALAFSTAIGTYTTIKCVEENNKLQINNKVY